MCCYCFCRIYLFWSFRYPEGKSWRKYFDPHLFQQLNWIIYRWQNSNHGKATFVQVLPLSRKKCFLQISMSCFTALCNKTFWLAMVFVSVSTPWSVQNWVNTRAQDMVGEEQSSAHPESTAQQNVRLAQGQLEWNQSYLTVQEPLWQGELMTESLRISVIPEGCKGNLEAVGEHKWWFGRTWGWHQLQTSALRTTQQKPTSRRVCSLRVARGSRKKSRLQQFSNPST